MTVQELIDKLLEIPEHRRKICNVCSRDPSDFDDNIIDVVLSEDHNYYVLILD